MDQHAPLIQSGRLHKEQDPPPSHLSKSNLLCVFFVHPLAYPSLESDFVTW